MSTTLVPTEAVCRGLGFQTEWRPGTPVPISDAAQAQANQFTGVKSNVDSQGFWAGIFQDLLATIGGALLEIMARVTDLAGHLLNGVIFYTVVNVKNNYGNLAPLLSTWKVIRDLANMSFIFILVYAGIMTILGKGSGNQKLITNVIVAAVLMNFSLFFTRVIIDISNLFALTFYDAIAPGAAAAGFLGPGLSTAFAKYLGIGTLYQLSKSSLVSWDGILAIGVMGSALLLVAAFSFAAVAILFIIRYVALILVMIFSPIMFLGYILPGKNQLSEYRQQWWDTLTGQAFFAPIYFLITWVALRVMDGVSIAMGLNSDVNAALSGIAIGNQRDQGALTMFINFAIVIVLMIAALVTAKSSASKGAKGMGEITKWATGKAGGAVFGGVGVLGRGTLGRAGQALGESEWLKEKAAKGGVLASFAARQGLNTGRKIGSATFDARNAPGLSGQLKTAGAGNAGGKGGFADYRKKKAEEEEKFAKSLAPSERAIAEAEAAVKNAESAEDKAAAQKRLSDLKGFGEKDVAKAQKDLDKEKESKIGENEAVVAEKELKAKMEEVEKEREKLEDKLIKAKKADNMEEYRRLAGELTALKDTERELESSQKKVARNAKEARSAIEKEFAERKSKIEKVDGAADLRKKAFANSLEYGMWAQIRGYNYAAAAKIRGGKKTAKDLIDEALKETGEKKEEEKKEESGGEKKEGDGGGEEKKTT